MRGWDIFYWIVGAVGLATGIPGWIALKIAVRLLDEAEGLVDDEYKRELARWEKVIRRIRERVGGHYGN